jgi:hypothetical protein
MRKALVMSALLAAVATSLAAAMPAGASPDARRAVHATVITPDNNLTAIRLCSQGGNNLCMNGHNGAGGVIKGFGNNGTSPDPTQDTNVDQVSNCGGVVTANATDGFCPFTNHNVDRDLAGDQIASIFNSANGMDYRWDNDLGDVVESNGGVGELWVKDGNLTGANAGARLVNVDATNNDIGDLEADACTNGSGQPLILIEELLDSNNAPSKCLWQGEAG